MNVSQTTPRATWRTRRVAAVIAGAAAWLLVIGLGLVVAAELVFFAIHAAHLLSYRYPLDYGEGPLLAQVGLLRSGTPIWQLYADPGAPPYAVVNYPPVYHLAAALIALPLGDALLAGRLVSLGAALGCVAALWALSGQAPARISVENPRRATKDHEEALFRVSSWPFVDQKKRRLMPLCARALIVLAFLGLPIVREWSVLMRVDMLGVCLGLVGLALVRRWAGRGRVIWAAAPLLLGLYVKPSLIAAPTAALVWLFFRDRRRALVLCALIAAAGGLAFALLQWASRGWFSVHILAANANDWQPRLARGFWHDQMLILWPLLAAAVLGLLALRLEYRSQVREGARRTSVKHSESTKDTKEAEAPTDRSFERLSSFVDQATLLPLYYTLFGALSAFGVGKVGAYANYFLEFYAGLIWLAAVSSQPSALSPQPSAAVRPSSFAGGRWSVVGGRWPVVAPLVALLVGAALLRYYPTWSATYLRLAGIIEKENPPRLAFGRYGVWQDLARERDILATQAGVNATLVDEVRAAGAPIFTDVPGVAAQAGQLARLQVFEHRQLFDAGRWDQRPLLRDLANGRVPLVVLDYLGNWLTPEMISLISHRYAQDGSRGTYDLYRPVETGPARAADLAFPDGLRLVGYHLAPSPGRPAFHAAETALLTLEWRRDPRAPTAPPAGYEVVTRLTGRAGQVLLETARPLLYGALAPSGWGDETMQHLQPIALPPELTAGDYGLAITLRAGGHDLAPPREIGRIAVEAPAGQPLGEAGYFVPAPLFAAWERAGGYAGYGDPLTPAVPFPSYTMQCFVWACLRLEGRAAEPVPLGELVRQADVGLRAAPPSAGAELRFAATGESLRGPFLDYWRANGAEALLGPPITPELIRNGMIVQYTRYARLERPLQGGEVGLGRLGEEFLRLPGGIAYRWP